MTASQIVPVVAAATLSVEGPDGVGYVLVLLVLDDLRVVSLDPSDRDAIYANMTALVRDGSSRGWVFGELVYDAAMLASWTDGYEIDGDAIVIGGGDGA